MKQIARNLIEFTLECAAVIGVIYACRSLGLDTRWAVIGGYAIGYLFREVPRELKRVTDV